jgi:hypothetical protein
MLKLCVNLKLGVYLLLAVVVFYLAKVVDIGCGYSITQ